MTASAIPDIPNSTMSLIIKQLEEMEDGWRIAGGKEPIPNKATGGNGGYFGSCGGKIYSNCRCRLIISNSDHVVYPEFQKSSLISKKLIRFWVVGVLLGALGFYSIT